MSFRKTSKMLILASACVISTGAMADHGGDRGKSDDHISATDAAAHAANSNSGSSTSGTTAVSAETLIIGASPAPAGAAARLRLLNLGETAGTATVALYDAATGTQLATWTSASIPPLGYLQVDISTLIAAATPALTATQAAAALEFGVRGTLKGTVQAVVVSNGIASDLSDCAAGGRAFGGVAGPGHTTLMSGLEFTNHSGSAKTATLSLRAADGTTLGTWTSASIPAHGSLTVSGAAIAAAANPVVAATTASFTAAVTSGLSVRHLSQPKAGGLVTNLTPACRIAATGGSGGRAHDDQADDDGADHDAGDDNGNDD